MPPPFIEDPPKPPRRAWLRRARSPAFHRQMLAVLRNALTGIGALCLLGLALVYWQGRVATREFDAQFVETAADFTRRALREDVAGALAVRLQAREGLTVNQIAKAMQARAKQLGIRQVARYPLSKYLPADKTHTPPYMEVFEFCDPEVAASVAVHNPALLLHFPCRIALYEDPAGSLWLAALNLDVLIHGSKRLPDDIRARMLRIQDGLLKIMAAGAGGN